jgi:hypothetical protein
MILSFFCLFKQRGVVRLTRTFLFFRRAFSPLISRTVGLRKALQFSSPKPSGQKPSNRLLQSDKRARERKKNHVAHCPICLLDDTSAFKTASTFDLRFRTFVTVTGLDGMNTRCVASLLTYRFKILIEDNILTVLSKRYLFFIRIIQFLVVFNGEIIF